MTEFEGVAPALSLALNKRGYEVLTPVQTAMLAPELAKADMLVSAQTGSGKTVAFGIAIAPDLLQGKDKVSYVPSPMAVVIAPTRELALQVKRELEWLYAETGAKIASVVGGMDMRTERRALQNGAHIVVGTPGRMRDHIERRSLDLSNIKAAILDEADEMLDLGFRDELEYILGSASEDRRTLLFSATVPRSIASLAAKYQRDAVRVETTTGQKQHLDIEYRALTVAHNDEQNAIINVLRYYDAKNAIVFCNTRATVNHMTSRFNNRGFSVVALSGELSQNERTHALQSMRDGRARVCIATDVAARGIDLPNLELVIHADLPKNREGLLHRSGRTGRAGRKGVSVLIVPVRATRRTERLLSTAKIDATWASPPSAEDVLKRDDERILSDSAISDPLSATETDFAQQLLAAHSPEQIAGALVRMYRKDRSAPEELRDIRDMPQRDDKPKSKRTSIQDGVWFSISVGRKQNAEPRWLLPMIANNGNIKRGDIGSIKIMPSVTYVEIAKRGADQLIKALGPEMKLEKTMTVTRLDGIPEAVKSDDDGKPAYKGKRHDGPPRDGKPSPEGKPKFRKRKGADGEKTQSRSAKRKRPKNKGNK